MPRFKDLSGQKFGKLIVIEPIGRYNKSEILYKCNCDCGIIKIARSGSLTKKTRPTRSCGCLKNQSNKKRLSLEFGQAHINRLFRQYKHNAEKRNLVFEIDINIFKSLITSCCVLCGIEPKEIQYKNSYNPNGLIPHNGIDRIDNSKGYILNNIRPMCSDCNRAKSNMSEIAFNDWLDRIVFKRIGKKGVAV